MVLVHMESLAPRAVKMTREGPAGALSTKDSLMGNISRQPLNGSRSAVPCRIIDGAAISSVPRFEVRQPRPRESYFDEGSGIFQNDTCCDSISRLDGVIVSPCAQRQRRASSHEVERLRHLIRRSSSSKRAWAELSSISRRIRFSFRRETLRTLCSTSRRATSN